jgi:hypothetical protein
MAVFACKIGVWLRCVIEAERSKRWKKKGIFATSKMGISLLSLFLRSGGFFV